MELSIHKWYKDSQYVAICTKRHQHICNIYVADLLRYFPTFVTGDETIIVTDMFQLLNNANEIFDTVATRLYTNVKRNVTSRYDVYNTRNIFGNTPAWQEYIDTEMINYYRNNGI